MPKYDFGRSSESIVRQVSLRLTLANLETGLCSFIAGYLSVCAELVLYAWAFTESLPPQIFASTLMGVALLPLGLFWLG